MAKPLKNIVHSIIEKLSKFKPTDDFQIPYKFIVDKVHDIRASMIREEWRNKNLSQEYYQLVCCIDVECEKAGCTINGMFISEGTKFYKATLPKLLSGVGDDNLLYLGTIGLKNKYTRKSFDGWMNQAGNRWTAYNPNYTIIENEAYLKNLPTALKRICILAILDTPQTACDWNDETSEYPVPSEYRLEMLVVKDILSTWGIVTDEMNDSNANQGDPRMNSEMSKQANR